VRHDFGIRWRVKAENPRDNPHIKGRFLPCGGNLPAATEGFGGAMPTLRFG
jgi:hypothetical protein